MFHRTINASVPPERGQTHRLFHWPLTLTFTAFARSDLGNVTANTQTAKMARSKFCKNFVEQRRFLGYFLRRVKGTFLTILVKVLFGNDEEISGSGFQGETSGYRQGKMV